MASDLEAMFATLWRQLDGPELVPEYQFAAEATGGTGPGVKERLRAAGLKNWRFDFAHVRTLVAVEIEGGVWGVRNKNGERVPGRHLQPQGFEDDARKYNAATADGWLVFRLTRSMMEADPVRHLTPIMDAIKWREEEWSA